MRPPTGYSGERVGGDGAPRWLLLHGLTGEGADWRLWPRDAPPALALDLPGHGGSPAPAADFGDEIARLLSALPASVDHLAGYSLGGRVALSLIAAAPRRFRAAIILSAHPGLMDAAARDARRAADRRWIALLQTAGIEAFVDAWQAQALFATQQRLPASVRRAQRQRRLAQDADALARSLACFGLAEMPDTRQALAHWPGRLDWIVGGADRKFATLAREVQTRRPDTRLHVLPGIGHNPLLEAPRQLTTLIMSLAIPMIKTYKIAKIDQLPRPHRGP
ncbi:alpha/beta fold hydrolase [Thiohalocapsa marina]|uniref:Alpha/beta fold hydrolase n=1 Tax=Thiohalocapsa marina TaxID=424902 RepID=A0A5M8FMR1_9GAMM|nr:alpha/beta fold hydrolase [Thiohalocapsa marina]KAA6186027.1 alpha/beta fold hydrolase [Thiohalocapsa marina]